MKALGPVRPEALNFVPHCSWSLKPLPSNDKLSINTIPAILWQCCGSKFKMLSEREQQISPIVQESVMHNTKVRAVLVLLPLSAVFPSIIFAPTSSASQFAAISLSRGYQLNSSFMKYSLRLNLKYFSTPRFHEHHSRTLSLLSNSTSNYRLSILYSSLPIIYFVQLVSAFARVTTY